jgi:putative transposase
MSRQVSPSTEQAYGLLRVTRVWGVSRATVYRHRHPAAAAAVAHKRPGPLGAMSDDDLVAVIRQLLRDSPSHGEGYRKLDRAAIKGPGCALPASAPAGAVFCGSWASTVSWPTNA